MRRKIQGVMGTYKMGPLTQQEWYNYREVSWGEVIFPPTWFLLLFFILLYYFLYKFLKWLFRRTWDIISILSSEYPTDILNPTCPKLHTHLLSKIKILCIYFRKGYNQRLEASPQTHPNPYILWVPKSCSFFTNNSCEFSSHKLP